MTPEAQKTQLTITQQASEMRPEEKKTLAFQNGT